MTGSCSSIHLLIAPARRSLALWVVRSVLLAIVLDSYSDVKARWTVSLPVSQVRPRVPPHIIGSQWVQTPRHGDPIASQKQYPRAPATTTAAVHALFLGSQWVQTPRHGGPILSRLPGGAATPEAVAAPPP
jgi:hypothetical protein